MDAYFFITAYILKLLYSLQLPHLSSYAYIALDLCRTYYYCHEYSTIKTLTPRSPKYLPFNATTYHDFEHSP